MHEYVIKVYEHGNIRLPAEIRRLLSINKGNELVVKVNKDKSINMQVLEKKVDEIRASIQSLIGIQENLVDKFLAFKKSDDSKF